MRGCAWFSLLRLPVGSETDTVLVKFKAEASRYMKCRIPSQSLPHHHHAERRVFLFLLSSCCHATRSVCRISAANFHR